MTDAPADIPTRFMAEWLWRCLVECNNSGIKDAVPFYAARLKTVGECLRERKAA